MKTCDDCGKRVFKWIEFEDDDTILCRNCYDDIMNEERNPETNEVETEVIEKEYHNNYYNDQSKIISEENINLLLSENSSICVSDIRKLLNEERFDKAFKLYEQRKNDYKKYVELEKELELIKNKIKGLTEKISIGDLTSDAFTKANENLNLEKKEVEEQLWKLKNKIFKDKYEKPF